MGSRITQIDYHLPERVLTNDELAQQFEDWNSKKIERKTGVRERHIAASDETSLDLAVGAAERVLSDVDRGTIDFLINCTQTPDFILPGNAGILQDRLRLRNDLGAMDISLGCSGFVYGLSLAKGLIETDAASRVLLVMSETYSKVMHPMDRVNRTIFGDGAAAVIVEKDEDIGIGQFVFGTDGNGAACLTVPNGGFRHPCDPKPDEIESGAGGVTTRNHLYMNGPEIFNFMIERVPALFDATLIKNGLNKDDLGYVVLHQANRYMLEYARTKMDVPGERFHNDLTRTGNTVSATIPIALKDAADAGKIGSGDKVFLAGFGLGLSWAGTIVTF
jgi:3-oxoacyl-[acyl-carrier-protein] synthase III